MERFQSVRPDATIRIGGDHEIFVELDDRIPKRGASAKLERYDHFLAGWSASLERYAHPNASLPLVVFVCSDRSRAREGARQADTTLRACRAYPGEYPDHWEYPGRSHMVFVSERDVHEGQLHAWGVSSLPPDVRVAAAEGDPSKRGALVEQRSLENFDR